MEKEGLVLEESWCELTLSGSVQSGYVDWDYMCREDIVRA